MITKHVENPGPGILLDIIDALNYPLYVIDARDYRILLSNAEAGRRTHPPGATCYQASHHRTSPCPEDNHPCPLELVKKHKKPVVLEHIHHNAGGEPRLTEVHGYPVLDDSGEVIQMIEYTVDITSRKLVETALKQRIQMEQLISGISTRFVARPEKDLGEKILQTLDDIGHFASVDRSYALWLSQDGSTVSGVHEWCAGGIPSQAQQLREVSITHFSYAHDKLQKFQPFQVFNISELPPEAKVEKEELENRGIKSILLFPMSYRGELMGLLGFHSMKREKLWSEEELNILEMTANIFSNALIQQKAQEKLQDSENRLKQSYGEVVKLKEEAEAANRLKSHFLANMSHDIRTPLNSILGFADLMLKEERNHHSRNFLDKIKQSGTALLALLNDILDFSKIEAAQLDIIPKSFPLKELLDNIVSIFELQAPVKDLDFSLHAAGSIPTHIHSDQWRLHQVLTNLLSNAFKFTRRGGVSLHLSFDALTDLLVFEVNDTGTGMTAETLERIFDPFFQALPEDSGEKKGTGLGLAICKNLVNLMGGTIEVTSELHRGTGVSISIPANSHCIKPGTSSAGTLTREAGDNLKEKTGNTILVVDDNRVNLELILEQCKVEGFHSLLTATGGEEALELVKHKTPDLILMDIQMPGMDGNEAIRLLRAGGYRGPIVALSAYAMQADAEQTLKIGANGYITKPIDFDTFFEKIGQYLPTGLEENRASRRHQFAETVSGRIREVFINDAGVKINLVKKILETNSIGERGQEIRRIAHTYKGNAAYLGLGGLENAARDVDLAFKKNAPKETLLPLIRKLVTVLGDILNENTRES